MTVREGTFDGKLLVVAAALLLAALALALALALFLTATSPEPWTPDASAPTAEAVAAGRDAHRQIQAWRGIRRWVPIKLRASRFAGLGAVASRLSGV